MSEIECIQIIRSLRSYNGFVVKYKVMTQLVMNAPYQEIRE
jgi:hypothetical protein